MSFLVTPSGLPYPMVSRKQGIQRGPFAVLIPHVLLNQVDISPRHIQV